MDHQRVEQQLSTHDSTRNVIVAACAAVSGVLGYGIARGLARATEYAEQVEEDEYCREPTAAWRS
jgi:hypothetical protein